MLSILVGCKKYVGLKQSIIHFNIVSKKITLSVERCIVKEVKFFFTTIHFSIFMISTLKYCMLRYESIGYEMVIPIRLYRKL